MALRNPHLSRFTPEERIGLIVAVAAHVGLFTWLALDPLGRDIEPAPQRMTVSFADEVALESTSPEPMAQAAPDVAPERGETSPEPEPVVVPEPARRVVASPLPRPSAKPTAAKPKVAAKPAAERRRPDAPKGASRVGEDFLKGIPGGQVPGGATNPAGARASPQVAASLSQAIARQLVPHWKAPQGADAEKLTTYLSWDLNEDGSLVGRPRMVRQEGITDANRAQASRHAEQAIRAVQLAAPFKLPAQYYATWRKIRNSPFDRNLLQ